MAKINGDTVEEFIANANIRFKDSGGGITTPKHSYRYASFKEGKLVKLQVTFSVDMDFAEVGAGKPDELNKAAIALVADLVKKHEESHRAGYQAAFKAWNDKVPDEPMKTNLQEQKRG